MDTYSVVLGSPIHSWRRDIFHSIRCKLEYIVNIVNKGIFLAPKSYSLFTQEDKRIIKHKGIEKKLVNEEWFEKKYADISRTKPTPVESNFKIDWQRDRWGYITFPHQKGNYSQTRNQSW